MRLIGSELNQRLSDWVHRRALVDGRLAKSQAAFWRLLGAGLIALGIGAAAGTAMYGYGHVARNSENLSSLAPAITKALSNVRWQAAASGTVDLKNREISLAKDQTVSLDRNAQIRIDPSAKVVADGELRVQAMVPVSQPTARTSEARAITNFTVFKRVPFEKGTVLTGWTFLTSSQKEPTEEYCYYTMDADTPGINVVLELGANEKAEMPKTLPANFDIEAAFKRCVWFRGAGR